MITFTEFLSFAFASAGITSILVYSSILERLRPKKGRLGELAHCPMCMGFWVGAILCGLNGFTDLFNFERTWLNYFLCGGISSAASYIFATVFGDNGLKFEHNHTDESEDCPHCKENGMRQMSMEDLYYMADTPAPLDEHGGHEND